MSKAPITTFAAFWPFYLGEHRSPTARSLHYLGTSASLIMLGVVISMQAWPWLWLVLVAGYGPAWIGHFFFERNRPATFQYPLWSLLADYKMFAFAITGRLRDEYQKYSINGGW
ncbi:MAG: DUF962 domain-containing protein [Gammaproteobacteria bacterium]|nr:DUF962 domain-containing protein [Gammaproteobacteria bacterium]NVK86619.1 DUF962 domain-containing protein [Gammaproteobacteria bacterium]